MTRYVASARMAPSRLRMSDKLTAPVAPRRASTAPSATVVVAKIVFVTMLLFLGLTIVATAPLIVASLLALVAGVGVLVSLGRRRASLGRARRMARRLRLRGDAGWAALGVSSVALLVIALAMPEGYDVALATLGIVGLAVLRLWAVPRPRLGSLSYRTIAVTAQDSSSEARTRRRARDDPGGRHQTGRRRQPIAVRPSIDIARSRDERIDARRHRHGG